MATHTVWVAILTPLQWPMGRRKLYDKAVSCLRQELRGNTSSRRFAHITRWDGLAAENGTSNCGGRPFTAGWVPLASANSPSRPPGNWALLSHRLGEHIRRHRLVAGLDAMFPTRLFALGFYTLGGSSFWFPILRLLWRFALSRLWTPLLLRALHSVHVWYPSKAYSAPCSVK